MEWGSRIEITKEEKKVHKKNKLYASDFFFFFFISQKEKNMEDLKSFMLELLDKQKKGRVLVV